MSESNNHPEGGMASTIAGALHIGSIGFLVLLTLVLMVMSFPPLSHWLGPISLLLAAGGLGLIGFMFWRLGALSAFWFSLVIAGIMAILPQFDFAVQLELGWYFNAVLLIILPLQFLIFVSKGPQAGGRLLLAVTLVLAAFLLYRPAYDWVLTRLDSMSQEAADNLERENDYQAARAIIDDRLAEMEGLGNALAGSTLEDKLYIGGLAEAEAQRIRNALEIVEKYEGEEQAKKADPTSNNVSWRDNREKTSRDEEAIDETSEAAKLSDEVVEGESDAAPIRTLVTPKQRRFAEYYAHSSLGLVRFIGFLTMILGIYAYLRELNSTLPELSPLPWASRLLDALHDKERAVGLLTDDPDTLAGFLEMVARKGESFIYFGPELEKVGAYAPRWGLGKFAIPGGLEILGDADPEFFWDSKFVSESAWFGRLSFIITHEEGGIQLLQDMREDMKIRTEPKATAWKTVNLVWNHEEPMPEELLHDIIRLAKRTNLRVVLTGDHAEHPELEAVYEHDEIVRALVS